MQTSHCSRKIVAPLENGLATLINPATDDVYICLKSDNIIGNGSFQVITMEEMIVAEAKMYPQK